MRESKSIAASPELEIEVTYLLNAIKANLGEQVSLTRTTDGALRVEAIVETAERKEEILRALSSVRHNPAIIVDVHTVAEAARRASPMSGAVSERKVEAASGQMPAIADLRRYFAARGEAADDQTVVRVAERIMHRSRQAVLHASALQRLVKRFPATQLDGLAPDARDKWQQMIREHAQNYEREAGVLRRELKAIFPDTPTLDAESSVYRGDAAKAAAKLLQLSYAQDDAVRSAFTVSIDNRTTAALKAHGFWRSLSTAEKLSASIREAYRK
jgi:hypothetical protein